MHLQNKLFYKHSFNKVDLARVLWMCSNLKLFFFLSFCPVWYASLQFLQISIYLSPHSNCLSLNLGLCVIHRHAPPPIISITAKGEREMRCNKGKRMRWTKVKDSWKRGRERMEKRKERKRGLKVYPPLLFNLDARRKSILPFDTQSESRRIKRAEINSENIFDGVACSLSAKWTAKWNKWQGPSGGDSGAPSSIRA